MSTFHFKQFSIEQKRSAMKVGTDAMLLGSIAGNNTPTTILDVGAGTGVIALMMAQRFPEAKVSAIELNSEAFEEAQLNFTNSPFSDRVHCEQRDFKDYITEERFDLIVSNPPYFINSLLSSDESRSTARHADSLTPEAFIEKAVELISKDGQVIVIVPADLNDLWVMAAKSKGLYLQEIVEVRGKEKSPPNRVVLTFDKKETRFTKSELTVRNKDGKYTDQYILLTRDFHDRIPT